MSKFYDENGEEVDAFSAEEVEAKITEAKNGLISKEEVDKLNEELSNSVKENKDLTKKYEESEARAERLNTSYEEARIKLKENKQEKLSSEEEKKNLYTKIVEDNIKARAGEDKELEEALRAKYESRSYDVTISPDDVSKRLDEELLITQHTLNREIKPFNPAINSGEPPKPKSQNPDSAVTDDVVNDALTVAGVDV